MDDHFTTNPHVRLPNDVIPAELELWAARRIWTRWQGVALALGADPNSLANYVRSNGAMLSDPGSQTRLFKEVSRLDRLTKAHFPHEEFADGCISFDFVNWLQRNELPCPSDLFELIEHYQVDLEAWKSRAQAAEARLLELESQITKSAGHSDDTCEDVSLTTRERDSLLKLVIGMAVKGYAFDPKAGRSKVATEIASDLQQLALSLGDDTIRKYLREGADLLPPQQDE